MPYVQKSLLAETLKYNYLGNPALTLVKELTDIDEIWERLIKSYGDPRNLLLNKLRELCQLGGLENISGDENLIRAISELLNVMSELKRLAGKYDLRHDLYQARGGLGKFRELIGQRRFKKLIRKNMDLTLGYEDEWDRIAQQLELELGDTQRYLVSYKARQPLCFSNRAGNA